MKRVIAFVVLATAASCIDPYNPNLKGYKSLLVVEGQVTNENRSYKVKLCRTVNDESSTPDKVTNAEVSISDNDGIKTILQNCNDGYYKTDSLTFTGVIGKEYTLSIKISDGSEYLSEPCKMFPVPDIDSVYYEKADEILGEPGINYTGLKILLNSSSAAGMNKYFRWTYDEAWEFPLPSPQTFECTIINDTLKFHQIPDVNEFCWKTASSGEIILNTILAGQSEMISREEIKFIPPKLSDRLTKEYSILVKQYSLSEKEYEFWNNLKKINEAGGSIFDSQPYPVISNIYNVKDKGELVMGYFEVSAVSQKRIFIPLRDLDSLSLPQYQTPCTEFVKSPADWPPPSSMGKYPTWEEVWHIFMDSGDFTFVRPVVNADSTLKYLVFSLNTCSHCEASGSLSNKPDFWKDL
jgi:hypothetical protein